MRRNELRRTKANLTGIRWTSISQILEKLDGSSFNSFSPLRPPACDSSVKWLRANANATTQIHRPHLGQRPPRLERTRPFKPDCRYTGLVSRRFKRRSAEAQRLCPSLRAHHVQEHEE